MKNCLRAKGFSQNSQKKDKAADVLFSLFYRYAVTLENRITASTFSKRSLVPLIMISLLWLPIKFRIQHKIFVTMFKSLGQAPAYSEERLQCSPISPLGV